MSNAVCLLALTWLPACAPPVAPVEAAPPAMSERFDIPTPNVSSFQSGFYLPLNDVPLGKPNGAQLLANGNVAVSWADSSFAGEVDQNGVLVDFDAGIGLNGAVTLEFAVDQGGDLSSTMQLATIPLPPLTFGDVVVTPWARVKVILSGSADAGAVVSVVAPFRIDTDFSNSGAPQGNLSSPPGFFPEIGTPDLAQAVAFDGSVEVEVTVSFLTMVNGFPIGGPVVGSSLGAALAVDPGVDPWWELDGLVTISGGWTFADPVTGVPLAQNLHTFGNPSRFDIADAGAPLPMALPSTRWSEAYDILNSDSAAAVVPVGEELVVVEAPASIGGTNPWLASIDGFGTARWQSTSPLPIAPTAMVATTDGDLVVCGAVGTTVRIDRYDATSGDEVWTRTLAAPGAARTTCEAMIANGTDGVVFAGEVNRGGVSFTPIVAELDEDGTVVWVSEYDTGAGSTSPTVLALAETPTGEILLVGDVDYTDTTDPATAIDGQNALILRIDAQGVAQDAYAVGGGNIETAQRVAVFPDGSYAIAGFDPGGVAGEVWVATFRADDTLRWSASYQSRPDEANNAEFARPVGLVAMDGLGLLVAGSIGSLDEDGWVLRLNADGMPIWLKTYASDERDELLGVVALPDGLVAFGSTEAVDPALLGDLWVVRTNVDGMLHFTEDSALDTENTDAQWQRTTDHSVHALAPVTLPSALDGNPAALFVANPASIVGDVLTE